MATVKAKLRVLDLRGETIHTRWGFVTFDGKGEAELEVPEEELDMLRQTRPFPWLDEGAEAREKAAAAEKQLKAEEAAQAKRDEAQRAEHAARVKADEEKMLAHQAKKPEPDKKSDPDSFDTSDVTPAAKKGSKR